MKARALLACAIALAACNDPSDAPGEPTRPPPGGEAGLATATFAGGCFWCMEPPFDRLAGVVDTTAGYTGGDTASPSYEDVSKGGTGHAEAVRVRFDPERVSYETLLEVFWRNVDPLDAGGQFCDRGASYRTAIFVHDAAQERLARASLEALAPRFDAPIATTIEPARAFYPAEAYHQNYAERNPVRYRFYRTGCRRDARLEALWGEESGGGAH